jgi:hypothetical protein
MDTSNCLRYTSNADVDSFIQELIPWLSDKYPEIFLIHQESHFHVESGMTRLTLIHRHWGPTVIIEIIPINTNQSLILIPPAPDPGMEDVSIYEAKILEHLPESSTSIRLAWMDSDNERFLLLTSKALREQRNHCWMQFHFGLMQSLRLELYEGDPERIVRDIPNNHRDIDPRSYSPSKDECLVLDLWAKGYTAKQIALRTGRTEKTILNRVTLMRKTYGEQLVPRHRMS